MIHFIQIAIFYLFHDKQRQNFTLLFLSNQFLLKCLVLYQNINTPKMIYKEIKHNVTWSKDLVRIGRR